jgi:hypothetical protein
MAGKVPCEARNVKNSKAGTWDILTGTNSGKAFKTTYPNSSWCAVQSAEVVMGRG